MDCLVVIITKDRGSFEQGENSLDVRTSVNFDIFVDTFPNIEDLKLNLAEGGVPDLVVFDMDEMIDLPGIGHSQSERDKLAVSLFEELQRSIGDCPIITCGSFDREDGGSQVDLPHFNKFGGPEGFAEFIVELLDSIKDEYDQAVDISGPLLH